jgi:hypothetical protein
MRRVRMPQRVKACARRQFQPAAEKGNGRGNRVGSQRIPVHNLFDDYRDSLPIDTNIPDLTSLTRSPDRAT